MNLSWSSSRRTTALVSLGAAAALALAGCGGSSGSSSGGWRQRAASGEKPIVGLITKTDTNPFFVKMKEGAQQAADKAGVTLQSLRRQAGRRQRGPGPGDREPDLRGRQGHPDHAERLEGHRARRSTRRKQAGMLVDRARHPDRPDRRGRRHLRHRQLPGRRADRRVGQGQARPDRPATAKIAMLDLERQPALRRRQARPGLPEGLRHRRRRREPRSATRTTRGSSATTCTDGAEDGGRTAMENLLQKDPDINLVYTINEPAAAGAYQALKAAGKDKARHDRLGRRRLPRRPERQGGPDRRHLAAVPAEDGAAGRRGGRGLRQGRHQARRRPRARTSSTPASR